MLPQLCRCFVIDLVWGSVVKGLVLALAVVEPEVLREAAYDIGTRLVVHDKDILIFHGSPQRTRCPASDLVRPC